MQTQPRTNGAETKARILSAATDLFSEKGYSATSLRTLAAAIKIEPASFYNHFASKEEILYEIILRSTEASIALMEEYVADAADSPADRLKAATKAHVVYHCQNYKTAHIGWSDLHSLGAERYKQVTQVRDKYEAFFRREIQAGIDCGQFAETNITLATNGIIGIGSRTAVWYRPDGTMTASAVGEYYGDFVLRSLFA